MISDLRHPLSENEFPVLADGVVVLRCLSEDDAEAHLAGEDEDQIRWLNGGPGSLERILEFIGENREQWRTGGPGRHFGIRDAKTDRLIGNAEAHLELAGLAPGEVNISYAVFPKWRGRGVARRAVLLICDWLRADPRNTKAVIRIAPENTYSHGVPRSAGFTEVGPVTSPEGEVRVTYVRVLTQSSGPEL